MSMYKVVSCVVGRGFCYDQCILLAKLLDFALLHFVLQGQACLLFQISLDFLLLNSSPLWWKGYLWLILVLGGLIGLHRIVHLLQCYWLGHRFRLLWFEWFALEITWDHFGIFEIATKYCISDSFDCEVYSISSKGFLLTVVGIMVIWIHPFQSILVHWFLKCWCSLLSSPVWPHQICLDSWT